MMESNKAECKKFQEELPDLVLTANARPSIAAAAHMKICPPCAEEYLSFQQTFGLLDTWKPVEPTPYFNGRMAVKLREEQAAPAMSFFQKLHSRLLFNTGRNFRPAMAGALALALLAGIGGGTFAGLSGHSAVTTPQASATVQDLQILDRNEQAFQQMDELQQDDDSTPAPAGSALTPAPTS